MRDTPAPISCGDRLRALAAPVLLIVIALLGAARSAILDQSSWQGASFGMFATYDNRTTRVVVVQVEEDGVVQAVPVPAELRPEADRLLVVPSQPAADSLADRVLQSSDHHQRAIVEVRALVLDGADDLQVSWRTITSAVAPRIP